MDIFWYQNYKLALSLFSCLFEKNHHAFYQKFIKSGIFIFSDNFLFLFLFFFFLLSYFLQKSETCCGEVAGWDVDEGFMSI